MTVFVYLLELSISTFVFAGLYQLFFKKLTFFKLNRIYLVGSLLVSLTIPCAKIEIGQHLPALKAYHDSVAPIEQLKIKSQIPLQLNQSTISPAQLLFDLYVFIAVLILGINIYRLYQLYRATRAGFQLINGLKVIFKGTGFVNCSFFYYVFVDPSNLTTQELDLLLQHEALHASKWHTADKLLLMLCKSMFWFNPALYWYARELENIHEFEVDAALTKQADPQFYARLLIKLANPMQRHNLVHNFGTHPVRARIMMLYQNRSNTSSMFRYALIIPALSALIWLCSVRFVTAARLHKKQFTLVLDAGHGGTDPGITLGSYTEKDIVLVLAHQIKVLALRKGLQVNLTRDRDVNVLLKDRAITKGDLLLSLHVNAAADPHQNGIAIMSTTPVNDQGRTKQLDQVSTQLYRHLKVLEGIHTADVATSVTGLYLLKNSLAPSVLLELGYLSNPGDRHFLSHAAQQEELAEAIVQSVLEYAAELTVPK